MSLFKAKEEGPTQDKPTRQSPIESWKRNVRAYRAHIICTMELQAEAYSQVHSQPVARK